MDKYDLIEMTRHELTTLRGQLQSELAREPAQGETAYDTARRIVRLGNLLDRVESEIDVREARGRWTTR